MCSGTFHLQLNLHVNTIASLCANLLDDWARMTFEIAIDMNDMMCGPYGTRLNHSGAGHQIMTLLSGWKLSTSLSKKGKLNE